MHRTSSTATALVVLLVALLRTWSPQPPLQTAGEALELPLSAEETEVSRGIIIDIGPKALYVDGWRAGSA